MAHTNRPIDDSLYIAPQYYLDAKMQPVKNVDALKDIPGKKFNGLEVVVLDDGEGHICKYWYVKNEISEKLEWQKKPLGATYVASTGINISANDEISVKIDGESIVADTDGKLTVDFETAWDEYEND